MLVFHTQTILLKLFFLNVVTIQVHICRKSRTHDLPTRRVKEPITNALPTTIALCRVLNQLMLYHQGCDNLHVPCNTGSLLEKTPTFVMICRKKDLITPPTNSAKCKD